MSAATARPARVWALRRDETLRLRPRGGGLSIRSHGGTFVVTQERDREDHVLSPGGEYSTSGRGVVVLWALSDGSVSVGDGPAETPPPLAAAG